MIKRILLTRPARTNCHCARAAAESQGAIVGRGAHYLCCVCGWRLTIIRVGDVRAGLELGEGGASRPRPGSEGTHNDRDCASIVDHPERRPDVCLFVDFSVCV